MQIIFCLTERDLLEAQRTYWEGSRRLLRIAYRTLMWVLRLFMLGLGLFFALFDEATRALGIVFIAIAILMIVIAPFTQKLSAKRFFRKNPHLQKECRIDISEQGVECSTEDFHSEVGWSRFPKWQESERIFLLYNSARVYSIFPKRAFAAEEVDAFRSLLTQKIPKR